MNGIGITVVLQKLLSSLWFRVQVLLSIRSFKVMTISHIRIVLSVFILCLLFGTHLSGSSRTAPRERFGTYEGTLHSSKIYKRDYKVDTIYAVAPGSEMLSQSGYSTVDGGIFNSITELYYLGRSSKNNVKIRKKEFAEITIVSSGKKINIADESIELEFYIDNPDSINTLKIGDFQSPSFILEVTLDESILYYRVMGDGVPLPDKDSLSSQVENSWPSLGDFVPVDSDPELIFKWTPEYPRLALHKEKEAVVTVRVLVSESGNVLDVVVMGSPSKLKSLEEYGFIYAAKSGARKCKFKPAYHEGKPIKVWVSFPYEFILLNK